MFLRRDLRQLAGYFALFPCSTHWASKPKRCDNADMNSPQTVSPRRRLQELLAIPDRLRSEAEWDELHELEISLAPGNRADMTPPRAYTTSTAVPDKPRPRPPRPNEGGDSRPRSRPSEGGGGEAKKTFRKRHRKPAKPATGGSEPTSE